MRDMCDREQLLPEPTDDLYVLGVAADPDDPAQHLGSWTTQMRGRDPRGRQQPLLYTGGVAWLIALARDQEGKDPLPTYALRKIARLRLMGEELAGCHRRPRSAITEEEDQTLDETLKTVSREERERLTARHLRDELRRDQTAEPTYLESRDQDAVDMVRVSKIRAVLGQRLSDLLSQGLTQRECAERLGVCVATVENRIREARKIC